MKIYRNNAYVTQQTVSESDNYGFVNQNWLVGNYSVFVKATWFANDVKDFTFRIYMGSSVSITQTSYTADTNAVNLMNPMDLAGAIVFGSSLAAST